jgi:TRAP-type C4-dicarboxylate transport system permease small subunit
VISERTRQTIRRWDDGLARFEGHAVTLLMLALIGVAACQALWFNLAERGVSWAARALQASAWADPFLHEGTLCVAFLGASLATHADRHFAIDLATRLAPERVARGMLRAGALGAALVSFALCAVFFEASLASDATVPFEYEHLTVGGRQHVCDAAGAADGAPLGLCGLRAALAWGGVPVSTFAGAAQLVVPLALAIIGLRLLARAAGLLALARDRSRSADGAVRNAGTEVAS